MWFRKARAAAFRARLQLAEGERDRIVEAVTKRQVNLSRIADRLDRVQNEICGIKRELKLLELENSEEEISAN